MSVLRLFKDDPNLPDGLSPGHINRWVGGLTKEVRADHLVYVFARLASLPDKISNIPAPWIALDSTSRELLLTALHRANVTPETLMLRLENIPHGLTARKIRRWSGGSTKRVNTLYWNFVLDALSNQATMQVPPAQKSRRIGRNYPGHRFITDDEHACLCSHRKRTGIGGIKLLNGATDKPKDLSAAMISGWLSGAIKTAEPSHLVYAMKRYEKMPSIRTDD